MSSGICILFLPGILLRRAMSCECQVRFPQHRPLQLQVEGFGLRLIPSHDQGNSLVIKEKIAQEAMLQDEPERMRLLLQKNTELPYLAL